MKPAILIFFICVLAISSPAADSDHVFQSSTLAALFEKNYDGSVTVGRLKTHGTLALGTYHAFDGEMIAIGGEFFKIKAADGAAHPVPDTETTPFAIVTDFDADSSITIEESLTLGQLQARLEEMMPSQKIFYAFKLEGRFRYVQTRSVFPQTKPYPELRDIFKTQATFQYANIEGSLIGFWYPLHTRCINSPGFHLHFISKDRKKGGHVLDLKTSGKKPMTIAIDYISTFQMLVPNEEPREKKGN
jgi:acetolactate decarboxylase